MSINRVVISGRLTRDPDIRATASGTPVVGLGVAVNDRRQNRQTGEWEDYANFVDCTWFGNRARVWAQNMHKGSHVAISGRLRWSQWETKEGQKRNKLEVIVDDLDDMTPRDSNAASAPAQQFTPAAAPAQPAQAQPVVDGSLYEEDIPF